MKQRGVLYTTSDLSVLSITFEKANVEARGRFSFFDEHMEPFVKTLKQRQLGDAFVLSTCNRTEIYATTKDMKSVAQVFCDQLDVSIETFLDLARERKGSDALHYFFRVASGLESQILGDLEIVSQMKKSYDSFKKYKKYSNAYLETLVNHAIRASKKIKNETQLCTGITSVAYAAVHYITKMEAISKKKILLVGLGVMGRNVLANLLKSHPNLEIVVTNRTEENALKIAEQYTLQVIDFVTLKSELKHVDVLVVATGANQALFSKEDIPSEKEICIIDLSVPNNVNKNVKTLQKVTLVGVDELSQRINTTMKKRQDEIPKAENHIAMILEEFRIWERRRSFVPKIHSFMKDLYHTKNEYRSDLTPEKIQKMINRFASSLMEQVSRLDMTSREWEESLISKFQDEYQEH